MILTNERKKIIKLIHKYQRLDEKQKENDQWIKDQARDNLHYKMLSEKVRKKNNRLRSRQHLIANKIYHIVGRGKVEISELGISMEVSINNLIIWETGHKPSYLRNYFK